MKYKAEKIYKGLQDLKKELTIEQAIYSNIMPAIYATESYLYDEILAKRMVEEDYPTDILRQRAVYDSLSESVKRQMKKVKEEQEYWPSYPNN